VRKKLKEIAAKLKAEFDFYRRLQKHPRTPAFSKALLWFALGYLLMPFDLIPDFLPVIGQLDDIIIVPMLIYFALKLIPLDVITECKKETT
jgi:uncharacterized membrane protein YkvA (DUF1232 family)